MKQTLIQIHYHLRAGGVATVIRRYSKAFSEVTNDDSQSLLICNEDVSASDDYTKIIRLNECEYKKYTDKSEFTNDRIKIESFLEQCINEQRKKGHVVVIAHNLALGKNLALTAAFYNCAKKNLQKTITFFSVVHDFAEEGRIGELDAIRSVEQFQNNIKKQMYCIGVPVKIVVPNQSTKRMMQKCGFDVTTVFNPVNCEKLVVDKKNIETIRHSVLYNAHRKLLPFNSNKQIAYYPVRIIPRKNIYEAILLSCIFLDSSLITGPAGNSEIDLIRYRNLNNFIRKNKLPVMTDVITTCNLQNDYNNTLIETIMLAADYIVSTSITEGFGYALFEPWAQEKMVIARKNSAFTMPDGWNGDSMYSFLPVPVKWVDINCLEKEYDTYFFECYGKQKEWSFETAFLHSTFIDFAALTESMQMSIIEMIIYDNNKRNEWLKIIEKSFDGWPGLQNVYNSAKLSVTLHSTIIRNEFNDAAFRNTFNNVFLQSKQDFFQQAEYHKIGSHFQSSDYFRLLPGNK